MSDIEPAGTFKSVRRRFLESWWKYDFFISYRWSDGSHYASVLEEKLKESGMECFLDRKHNPPGEPLRGGGQKALNASAVLILVVSPGCLASTLIVEEVEFFSRLGRRILPIDIGETLKSADPHHPVAQILSDAVRSEESLDALTLGPSDHVLREVEVARGHRRELQRRYRLVRLVAGLLSILLVFALVGLGVAEWQRRVAIWERDQAESTRLALEARTTEDTKPQRRLHVALQAAHTTWDRHTQILPDVEDELRQALSRVRGQQRARLDQALGVASLSQLIIGREGKQAVLSSGSAELILSDLETGKELARSSRVTNSFSRIVWETSNSEEKSVLAVDLLGDVHRWQPGSGLETIYSSRARNPGEFWLAMSLAISPDRGRIAIGGDRGLIKVIPLASPEGHTANEVILESTGGMVQDLLFLDDRVLISADQAGKILLWDLATFQKGEMPEPQELHHFEEPVWRLAKQQGVPTLVAGTLSGKWSLIELDTSGMVTVREMPLVRGPANPLLFRSDGRLLLEDGGHRMYVLNPSKSPEDAEHFVGHEDAVLGAWISEDGEEMVSVDQGGEARFWQMGTEAQDMEPRAWQTCGQPAEIIWAPERMYAILSCVKGAAGLRVLSEHEQFDVTVEGFSDPRAVAMSSSGESLLVREGESGTMALVGLEAQSYPPRVLVPKLWVESPTERIDAYLVLRDQIILGTDSGKLLVCSTDGSADSLETLWMHDRSIMHLASDGRWVFSMSQERLTAWPVSAGGIGPEAIQLFEHLKLRWPLALNSEQRKMVTGDQQGRFVVWSLSGSRPMPEWIDRVPGDMSLYTAALDLEGTRVAVAGSANEIRAWDLSTDFEIRDSWALKHPRGGVIDLDWSRDGRYLAVADSNSDDVVIWDVTENSPVPRTLPGGGGHSGWSVAWWANDQYILAASIDGSVRNFQVSATALLEEAERRVKAKHLP